MFYKQNEIPSDGWLSPTGKFYTCALSEHDELAEYIIESGNLYPELGGSYTRMLEENNWLRVYGNGLIAVGLWQSIRDTQATQEQINWMLDSSKTFDKSWNKNMLDHIRLLVEK